MEGGSLVAVALLASAERAEVFARPRDDVIAQGHLDAAKRLAIGGHIEEDDGHDWLQVNLVYFGLFEGSL